MAHDHDHDHHHDHEHGSELSEMQIRVRALESILTEKGYVEPAALDAIIEAYETKIGPHNGAQVVAKAWTDPAFKQALLEDATKAVGTLGHVARTGDHLVAVENTPQRHNMVVCTLCSCYPWEVLGLPPVWYKAAPYRSRAVKDPRGVLADFGVSAAEGHRNPRVGFDRRDALPRAADAPEGHRGLERGATRRTGHAQLDDRHRISENAGRAVMNGVHDMGGMDGFGKVEAEPNEPVFHAAWEGARDGAGARDGRGRRVQHRHVALLSRGAAAARLSVELLLQEMAARAGGPAGRQGLRRAPTR